LLAWRETIQREQDGLAEEARFIEAELEEKMLDGVRSFRDYVTGSDDLGTRFIMEFKTFFGDANYWEERSWETADLPSMAHPAYNTGALERLKRDGMESRREREEASGAGDRNECGDVGIDRANHHGR